MTPALQMLARVLHPRPDGTTPVTGALAGLQDLDASDLPRWKSVLERARPTGYAFYFPFLLVHRRPGRRAVLVGEDAGSLCVYELRNEDGRPHLEVLLPPVPMDVAVTRRCLERANDFNRDRSARILRIDAQDAAAVASIPGLSVRERRSQYLYAPRAFGDLRGRKYRTVRYHVSRVRRLPGLEVVPYAPSHAAACRTLLDRWTEQHRSAFGTSGDAGTSKRTLALAEVLGAPDLIGELVLQNERVVAFAFGGEIRPGLGCLFEAKTDFAMPGLAHFQCHSFLSKLDAYELVNGGSDARSAGIRQLKDSLRPVGMHVEHRGSQVAT